MNATIYNTPKDVRSLMQYAADAGDHFVFLAKSQENANNALFSEDAPRGFAYGVVKVD